jgi:hypothetical protein
VRRADPRPGSDRRGSRRRQRSHCLTAAGMRRGRRSVAVSGANGRWPGVRRPQAFIKSGSLDYAASWAPPSWLASLSSHWVWTAAC